jgi:hypothetical protein
MKSSTVNAPMWVVLAIIIVVAFVTLKVLPDWDAKPTPPFQTYPEGFFRKS